MFLGIDVGGTHTDAVIMHGGALAASCKVPTQHHDLLASIREATDILLNTVPASAIGQVNLSTTLSTNAIVEGRTEDVGVLVSAGPGIDPEHARIGRFYHAIKGSIDHRGKEIAPLDTTALHEVAADYAASGLRTFATVTKFSTRNPEHERSMAEALKQNVQDTDFIAMGHTCSAQLNFPRRVATAYYNASVWRLYNAFADAVETAMAERGITAPVYMLKADGGTMPLTASRQCPVESILSGPAASVMGIMALCGLQNHTCSDDENKGVGDSLILDIGGTTTDMALLASGKPVFERDGIDIGGYATTVRAVRTHSIGIGGDSHLYMEEGVVCVGPERLGPSMAQGGTEPTLIDALNVCGHAEFGDCAASKKGVDALAEVHGMDPLAFAQEAVQYALQSIASAVQNLVDETNSRPVYTISEMLEGHSIQPQYAYAMGGPALVLRHLLADALGYPVEVPAEYGVANAIGAALTRSTAELELFADTERGTLFIPTLGIERRVGKRYTVEEAQDEACEVLRQHMTHMGVALDALQVDVIEASSFSMVNDYGLAGRSIRVQCQVRPSILHAM